MKKLVCLTLFPCIAAVLAAAAEASVFDDAKFILQPDCDADGNGIITGSEAKNAINYGSSSAKSMYVCGSIDGTDAGKGILCPETDVALPRRGLTIRDRVIRLRTLTTTLTDGSDSVWQSGLQLTDFPLSTNMTAVYRFRWDGFVTGVGGEILSKRGLLLCDGYSWNADDGFLMYITPTSVEGAPEGAGDLFLESRSLWNRIQSCSNFVIETNKWYDFAISVQKNQANNDRICLYLYKEGPSGWKRIEKTVRAGHCYNDTRALSRLGVGTQVFGSGFNMFYPAESWTWRGLDGAQHGFNGDIHQFAYWDRVLSDDEIEEAFIGPESDASIGVANGSSDEFTDAGSGTYRLGGAWRHMKGVLASPGDHVDLILTNETGRSLARALHIKTCEGSSGALSLLVNGVKTDISRQAPSGGDVCFLVPESSLVEGADNTLRLVLESGGPVAIDYMAVGGGFMLKIGSGNNGITYNAVNMLDRDSNNYGGALSSWPGSDFTNRTFLVTLSDKIAGEFSWRWTVERGQFYGPIAAGYDVLVNGTKVYSRDGLMPSSFNFTVPRGIFTGGVNKVVFRNLSRQSETEEGYYFLNTLAMSPCRIPGLSLILR